MNANGRESIRIEKARPSPGKLCGLCGICGSSSFFITSNAVTKDLLLGFPML
jgi:hypothetical protein